MRLDMKMNRRPNKEQKEKEDLNKQEGDEGSGNTADK